MNSRTGAKGASGTDGLDMDEPSNLDRLMTVEEVAEYLCIPVNTLYQWRHKGTGPTAFRVGRYLRYDPSDVRSWLRENSGTDHGVH